MTCQNDVAAAGGPSRLQDRLLVGESHTAGVSVNTRQSDRPPSRFYPMIGNDLMVAINLAASDSVLAGFTSGIINLVICSEAVKFATEMLLLMEIGGRYAT